MQDNISEKLISKNSENIQKLFDLTTRIDERVKLLKNKECYINSVIEGMVAKNIDIIEKVASLEAKQLISSGNDSKLNETERRVSKLEDQYGVNNERWKSLANFMIQLIWGILAAYLLTKLNLQSPSVP